MITKWNRESVLITMMAVMILFGVFFYGYQYLIEPVREEARVLTETVDGQENLLAAYPPSEELLTEYETAYEGTESYLPLGAQANQALITLEEAAAQAEAAIVSVSRTADHQAIEQAQDHFVKNTYQVQITGETPAAFRALMDQLMSEERVWNITGFTYDRAGDNNYTGTFDFELAYYSDNPAGAEETAETEETASSLE